MLGSLCGLLLATISPTLPAPTPDSTARAAHPLKLGVATTPHGLLPTAAAEWALTRRLALQTRLGYADHTFGRTYVQFLPNDALQTVPYTQRSRQATAAVQARYYLQSDKPAFSGWYSGLGLGLTHLRETATRAQVAPESRTRLLWSPEVQVGRQWLFGQRVVLDLYLGMGATGREDFSFESNPKTYWDFYPAQGVQLGYAF